ncbi:MAG: DoxX family protein, partial [Terracidiphilus sp.]
GGRTIEAGGAMNGLLWIAQMILAGVFAFTGASKLFAYEKLVKTLESRSKSGRRGMSRGQATVIGLLELAGAVGVLTPAGIVSASLPVHLFILLAAGGLALLMVAAGIYHLRRQESAAPAVSLFLLAVLVIFGRWPR